VPNFSCDFIVLWCQTQTFSVDGWVRSSKINETAVAGEPILGSFLYGSNKRVDGIMGLSGDSWPLLRRGKGVVEFHEFKETCFGKAFKEGPTPRPQDKFPPPI